MNDALFRIFTFDKKLKDMNEVKEIWKSIDQFRGVDYKGCYEISNMGNVRSLDRDVDVKGKIHNGFVKHLKGKTLPVYIDGNGYKSIALISRYKSTPAQLHRLLAFAFIPNPDNKPILNHIDGNKLNNSLNNIEWCTYSENLTHAIHTGLHKCEKPINQLCPITNSIIETFRSIKEAARETNIDRQNISSVCMGKRAKAGGFNWEYSK